MIFHISHGARRSDSANDVDWFIVKPLNGETEKSVTGTDITHVDAVNSLLRSGRTVFEAGHRDGDGNGHQQGCRQRAHERGWRHG